MNHPNQDNQKDDLLLFFMVFVLILMCIFDKTPAKAIETYELEQEIRVIRLQTNQTQPPNIKQTE